MVTIVRLAHCMRRRRVPNLAQLSRGRCVTVGRGHESEAGCRILFASQPAMNLEMDISPAEKRIRAVNGGK